MGRCPICGSVLKQHRFDWCERQLEKDLVRLANSKKKHQAQYEELLKEGQKGVESFSLIC